jgi:hypothetical protein
VPDEDTQRWVSYSLGDLYPDWQRQARCADVGLQYYFGEDDTGSQPTMSITQVRRAAKLCDVCPVFYECLRHSLEFREAYGVWAGTSGRVRRRIFKLMDNGLTIGEVMEVFERGEGDRYRVPPQRQGSGPFAEFSPEPVARADGQGEGSLRADDRGEVAL